jgi:Transcriptional regulatory protein, C terminal
MNNDQLNLLYFIIGLAIGLLQLYVGQRQFETQQREKMDELRNALSDIKQRLAILQETNSQRTFDVQNRLMQFAFRDEKLGELTVDTTDKIKGLISSELSKSSGFSKKDSGVLDEKLDRILSELNAQVINLSDYPEQTTKSENLESSDSGVKLRLDNNTKTFWVADRKINGFTPTEFEILKFLYTNPNRVFSTNEIMKGVYGGVVYDRNYFSSMIYRMRKKIELDPSKPTVLKTIKGFGFMLAGTVD